jgi:hypothetical protein
MTAVIQGVCPHAFMNFGLLKITANVFAQNLAWVCALEKSGFQDEGLLRKHFHKDGHFIDARTQPGAKALIELFPLVKVAGASASCMSPTPG